MLSCKTGLATLVDEISFKAVQSLGLAKCGRCCRLTSGLSSLHAVPVMVPGASSSAGRAEVAWNAAGLTTGSVAR